MRDETLAKTQQTAVPAPLCDGVDSRSVAHWWRRPVSATSRSSKAICVLAATFALTAVLGFTPSKAVAEELGNAGAAQEETGQAQTADGSTGQRLSAGNDSDVRDVGQVSATVPDPIEPHIQPVMESSASLSLAAAYVSEEQNQPSNGVSGGEDDSDDDAARELNGEVLSSTNEEATVRVGSGETFSARGSALISLAPGAAALSVFDGGSADVASASTLSVRGDASAAVVCAGQYSSVHLSDSSAYASGEDCAAFVAADGATITVQRGNIEATSGSVVRIEGTGSRVSLNDVRVLSTGTLAELCGDVDLDLDGVVSTSAHAAAIYVAAGVPTVRLTNGSVVRGTILVADGADINIRTDATSRIDGRIIYLSATSAA